MRKATTIGSSSSSDARPGPRDLRQLAQWPVHACEALREADSTAFTRAQWFLGHKLVLHSDYSGRMGPETALRMTAMAAASGLTDIHVHRGNDILPLSLSVMLSENGPRHGFAGLLSTLPLEHQRAIKVGRAAGAPNWERYSPELSCNSWEIPGVSPVIVRIFKGAPL